MKTRVLILTVACLGSTSAIHGQVIEALSDPVLPRSDRLVIRGSGFGADQGVGRVEIAGVEAPISYWSAERIHAYVSEDAPLGTGDVRVFAPDESNAVPIEVAPRPPADGRVRWRFRADDNMLYAQPAVGPDGTIYCTGMYGHMYAVAPDGGLRWIVRAFGNTAPSVGPDGTIYVGGGATIKAWNPDGTERWRFDGRGTVLGGPNVGPDGNIYGATAGYTGEETGAFVLSPEGELLFNHPGLNFRGAPAAWEVAFGGDGRWYVTSGMGWPDDGYIGLLSFNLGGGHNWLRTGLGQARASAAGNVYVNNPQGNGITSYDGNGDVRWHVSLNDLPGRGPSPPALGPDETFYVPTTPPWFNAIDVNGIVRWSRQYSHHVAFPVVRGDNAMVVAGGYGYGYQELNVVQAIAPATGELLWSVDLPFVDSSWKVTPQWYGEFSTDGRTVYIPTSGTEAGEPFSFLYAIDTTLVSAGDVDGNGVVDFEDLLLVLAAWGACEGECPEDLDGDGVVGFGDLLILLANWS